MRHTCCRSVQRVLCNDFLLTYHTLFPFHFSISLVVDGERTVEEEEGIKASETIDSILSRLSKSNVVVKGKPVTS